MFSLNICLKRKDIPILETKTSAWNPIYNTASHIYMKCSNYLRNELKINLDSSIPDCYSWSGSKVAYCTGRLHKVSVPIAYCLFLVFFKCQFILSAISFALLIPLPCSFAWICHGCHDVIPFPLLRRKCQHRRSLANRCGKHARKLLTKEYSCCPPSKE